MKIPKEAQDRIHELTGGFTDDLLEALDQWEQEHAALLEIFDINQAQDISLAKIRRKWIILSGLLWENSKPSIFIKQIAARNLPKLVEAGEELERLTAGTKDLEKASKKVAEQFRQLSFFQKGE